MRLLRHGLVLTLLAGACGCGVINGRAGDRGERPQASDTAAAANNGAAAAAGGDARELYLDSLRRQALQPSVNLVQEYYSTKEAYPGGRREAVASGIDYRTKNVRMEKSEVIVADGRPTVAWASWCPSRSQYWFFSGVGRWSLKGDQCPSLADQAWLNDGLGVGGLTQQQADIFVQQLSGYQGLISARGKSIVERAGKQYVRLEIAVTPHVYGGGDPIGAGMYLDAFKYTELDATTHPYGLLAAGVSALDIVRYIDPQTRLPVYSETVETGDGEWHMHRVEYSFGGPVQSRPRPSRPGIPTMTWQPERR
ncbi:hypothetical protein [Actinomadura montaniterrae]|uniref:Lipoprotein n=1 Tax=Actinomadura montaniterrae TaxID=1803903 RepID=A0A6L3W5U8_9ACTN|nr:hypothetical protein [Actinomadura montaniterrae]KAB2385954.1 hypothetical protein F9B16_09155 [Actinomadura montaniterrae]